MNESEITRAEESVRNTEVAYDPTDLSARAVVMFLIFLAVGAALITLAMWGSYKYIIGVGSLNQRAPDPLITSKRQLQPVGGDPAVKFPEPRLQPDPVADMNRFRTQEEQILNSYGWQDEANGRVHIPIERAIDLVSAAGLPVRSESAAVAPKPPPAGGGAGQSSASEPQAKP